MTHPEEKNTNMDKIAVVTMTVYADHIMKANIISVDVVMDSDFSGEGEEATKTWVSKWMQMASEQIINPEALVFTETED